MHDLGQPAVGGVKLVLLRFQGRLRPPLVRNVPRDFRGPGDFSGLIKDGGNRHRNLDLSSVLADAHSLKMLHTLAPGDAGQYIRFLRDPVRRKKHEHGPADGLGGGVAENFFRARVPTGDDTVEGFSDDGVVRRLDDGGQLSDFLLGLALLQLIAVEQRGGQPDQTAGARDGGNGKKGDGRLRAQPAGRPRFQRDPTKGDGDDGGRGGQHAQEKPARAVAHEQPRNSAVGAQAEDPGGQKEHPQAGMEGHDRVGEYRGAPKDKMRQHKPRNQAGGNGKKLE